MTDSAQVNVRVPEKAKGLLARIARRLREDRGFLHRLKKFLDEEENVGVAAQLSDRVARLEGTMERMMHELPPESVEKIRRLMNPTLPRVLDHPEHESPMRSRWTVGEGKGRRLTPEGEEELMRLASEGEEATEIADRLGVRLYAVTRRLRARDAG